MFHLGNTCYTLDRPLVMGIVNVTPDSFSDGGAFFSTERAIAHALRLIDEGADILDIGGESTRPGAPAVTVEEELARVIPVLSGLKSALTAATLNPGLRKSTVALSIDTQKPAVMRAAIAAGATMVNDVNALRARGAIELCAEARVSVCLMHMQGSPKTMQQDPHYDDVVSEVSQFLVGRAEACIAAGVDHTRIVIDPGFGFGKTLEHNLALLRDFAALRATGFVTLVGLSRKSMFNALLQRDLADHLVPSVMAALLAVQRGAQIVRVHDVRETCDALKLWAEMDVKK